MSTKWGHHLSLLVVTSLLLLFYKTKLGSIVRACTFDGEMTTCVGINVSHILSLVFMLGIALAGLASVVAAPLVTAMLGMDAQVIIVAFCVVVIGGVGNILGTLAAALIIGIVESVGILILPQFAEAFMYTIVVISLFFRPNGLFTRQDSRTI